VFGKASCDPDVISCTPAEFDREMAFLARYFDVVRLCDIEQAAAGPRPLAVVTFDDGYKDNIEAALPILQRHNLCATFFVTTGFMDRITEPWWDRIVVAVMNAETEEIDVMDFDAGVLSLRSAQDRDSAVAVLLRLAKSLPSDRSRALADAVAERCGKGEKDSLADLMMTWDDVRSLHNAGMEIGSHTVTHPVLANCTDSELHDELAVSRERIQSETGATVTSIGYPVGGNTAVDERVRREAARCGYQLGCTYMHGLNPVTGWDPFSLLRLKMEVGADFARFRAKLLYPDLVRY
jgi:peptidoglycan/xylan/chitin deacetylase (PgdA/CDA1 family)